jgi:hypothetical protein
MESPETLGEKLVTQRSRQTFEEEAVVYPATSNADMEYSISVHKRSQRGWVKLFCKLVNSHKMNSCMNLT